MMRLLFDNQKNGRVVELTPNNNERDTVMATVWLIRIFVIIITVVQGFLEVSSCRTIGKEMSKGSKPEKRSILTYSAGSVFQLMVGINVEAEVERNIAGIGLAYQFNAKLPSEAQAFLLPQILHAKSFSIYDHLIDALDKYGYNGSECLKKMICQVGEAPFVDGILEEIITFVLSPSKHRSIIKGKHKAVGGIDRKMLLESEKLGKSGENCSLMYPNCITTPLDLITLLIL